MSRTSRTILLAVLVVFLFSGCAEIGSPPAPQSFTASAGAGEILAFDVDTAALTYSYTVTESSYGLVGQTGSGTLTENSDGSYTPSEFPTSRIHVYQNGIMVGAVTFEINEQTVNAPVVGLSNPITSIAALAGTYNFLGETCEGPMASPFAGVGRCNTAFGTLAIDEAGAYEACMGSDLTTDPTCADGTPTSGTIVSDGDGLFQVNRTGTTFTEVDNANRLLASAAPNGQNVLIIDTNDSEADGYGYGHLVGSTQVTTIDPASASGTWIWNANNGQSGNFELTCSSSTVCSTAGVTVTMGTPWAGLGTVTKDPYQYHVLLAGTGVYVQAAVPSQPVDVIADPPFNIYMEIGAHQ